ncbi:hypothetical protein Tco_0802311 [Tanacetum coccineum]|uniref:Uncharacterized protein n=1 Tax=Tanacetum coccineum TaxID=301880 RepID=A0ABQ5A2N7_9ASTR
MEHELEGVVRECIQEQRLMRNMRDNYGASMCNLSTKSSHGYFHHELLDFLFLGAEGGGALGSSGALKSSTHPVMAIFLYPLKAKVEADCALEVEAMGAMDLVEALKVEVEAVGALDLVEAVGALDLVEGALDHVEV